MSTAPARRRMTGAGRVLVAVYAILALAATGRSAFQLATRFHEAPIAYLLSAVAAVVYIVATVALALRLDRLAWIAIGFELAGVLVIGTLSLIAPEILGTGTSSPFGGRATVWSVYGAGYVFVPLVLPVLGLAWLRRSAREPGEAAA